MRVAVFTDNDFAKVNGVTTTLRALVQWAPPDIEVRIYTADGVGRSERHYLSLKSFGMGIPFYCEMKMYVPRLMTYLRQARQDGIDVVHLTTPGPVGLAALFVAARLQKPLVGSFHTDLTRYASLLSGSEFLGSVMTAFLRWPYGRCHQILVPSRTTGELLEAARIARGHCTVWPRGVDAAVFTPARRSRELRDQWHIGGSYPVIAYAGRLSREKGLSDFVSVTERLQRGGLRHRLVFIGDGPMRAELERAMPEAVFVGSVPHSTMPEYLASADIFVFPSRTDTAGNVVLEAQACGLPAVVTNEGGPKENVVDGETAFVTGGDGQLEFAAAVEHLVREREVRIRMGESARRYAVTRQWPSALKVLFDTYRHMAPASPPGVLAWPLASKERAS